MTFLEPGHKHKELDGPNRKETQGMRCISVLIAGAYLMASIATAQSQTVQEPSGSKTLAATMNVYVFPAEGQAADLQNKEESECYSWAVKNTGNDPFELAKKAEIQQQQAESAKQDASQAGKGAGAKGALGGAAVGALIGEIADDDAGRGAAYGAGAGLLIGRSKRRQAQRQATAQVEGQAAQNQAYTQEQVQNFKKAFSVCLEAKDYMVKF